MGLLQQSAQQHTVKVTLHRLSFMPSVPFFIALPKVIVLNVVMLSVLMLNVVKLNFDMLSLFYVKYHFYCYAECLKEQQALKMLTIV
jgi:hypothetical protein